MENLVFKSSSPRHICNSIKYNWKFFLQKYSKKKDKDEAKNIENINAHSEQIFDTYQEWIDKQFIHWLDFISFHLDHLSVNITNQIIKIKSEPDGRFKSKWERALMHLNYEEYIDAYNKYKEILKFEIDFNNNVNQFIQEQRDNIIREIELQDVQDRNLISNLLRIILSKSRDMGRPDATKEAIEFGLSTLMINIHMDEDEILLDVTIENPFPQKSENIRTYLRSNYKDIYKLIYVLQTESKKLPTLIKNFQDNLQLILDNKINGLKGKCDYET